MQRSDSMSDAGHLSGVRAETTRGLKDMDDANASVGCGDVDGGTTFSAAARACGIKVALGLSASACLLGMIGKAIEQQALIRHVVSGVWTALLWGVALGGHFWGAVSVGCAAMAVFAWAWCVSDQLPRGREERAMRALVWTGACASALWLLANLAMQATYETFDAATVYQKMAVVAMSAPWIVVCVGLVGAMFFVFARAEEEL